MATEAHKRAQRKYGRKLRQRQREQGKKSIFLHVDIDTLNYYKKLSEQSGKRRDDILQLVLEAKMDLKDCSELAEILRNN